ncbi:alanine racemase [Alteromonas confluentis]|uniref:Alanine racemase n=1 Tax=Alteromonas confluentis TaxID=1656094 RepID=A0A1E7Z8C5_9ALTE|nr:alanine racemase [Alteromonas confluentis]OFC69793.1 alanine racemase [Alteromonas confluentis]
MSRQTRAIIHADAIEDNFRLMKKYAGNGQNMAVVKADAYGHGAVSVARILRNEAAAFAVAIIEEALLLREAGVRAPIVVLEGPHQALECELAARENCTLVVHQREQLEWVRQCREGRKPKVWLKVDSGMHRLGFDCERVPALVSEYSDIIDADSVLVTHLACADDTANPFTVAQLHAFNKVREATGLGVSIASSPGTVGWPQSRGDWNRIGIAMYGAEPLSEASGLALKPAMSLQASIIALRKVKRGETVGYSQTWQAERDSLIATVGIGYADGYPRHMPSGTPVIVKGQRAALAGRVSMDMITIDVTDIADVAIGDFVELWGKQLLVDEIARCAGTISYELITRVSQRVPRIVRHI